MLLDGLAGCEVHGDVDAPVTGVAYHSREVTPGGLFVALKGARTDGHLYLTASLDQGARVVVTEQELAPPPECHGGPGAPGPPGPGPHQRRLLRTPLLEALTVIGLTGTTARPR